MADGKQIITKKTTAKAATSGGLSEAPVDPPASSIAAAKGVTKKTTAKAAPAKSPTKTSATPAGATTGGATTGAATSPAKATSTRATTNKIAADKATSAKSSSRKATPAKSASASSAPGKATAKAPASSVEDRAVILPPSGTVTPEERWRMVADAAYYRAEKRDFAPGYEQEDWLSAEAEVAALLQERGQV